MSSDQDVREKAEEAIRDIDADHNHATHEHAMRLRRYVRLLIEERDLARRGARAVVDANHAELDALRQQPKSRCKCGEPGTGELHECPYQSEINCDDTPVCNCCDGCRGQCSDDV
jgi:hypothetical protein